MEWTEERIEQMFVLHNDGLSTARIAAMWRVSKNTIVGKLYREKVRRGLLEKKARIRTDRKPAKRKAMPTPSLEPVGCVFPAYSVTEPVPDQGQIASIVDVSGCRWPVKDDPAFVGGVAFCNAVQSVGSPYCFHHRKEGTVTLKLRKAVVPFGLRFAKGRAA